MLKKVRGWFKRRRFTVDSSCPECGVCEWTWRFLSLFHGDNDVRCANCGFRLPSRYYRYFVKLIND